MCKFSVFEDILGMSYGHFKDRIYLFINLFDLYRCLVHIHDPTYRGISLCLQAKFPTE